jgi:large subunit ribosomal protein L25
MSEVVISAERRNDTGKSITRKLRRDGKVPGILYGADVEPTSVTLDAKELSRLLRHGHSIINIKVDGDEQMAVIKSVQNHPLNGKVIHIDFMRVVAGQEITVTIPIHIVGTAEGTKEGGVFSSVKHDIRISVLPKHMPDSVEVDCSALEIGDAIRVKDISMENVTILDDEEELICNVILPRKEEEVVEKVEELEEEADSMEPEVITARGDDKESESEE